MTEQGTKIRAYIGLGSNLDGPMSQVMQALEELDQLPQSRCVARSSLYLSKPMGPPDQPEYVNAAAALDTSLGAEQLLQCLQALEQRHGRVRGGQRWGARALDLDLLAYGQARIDTEVLTVPHPGIVARDFVLYPLYEIAPALELPEYGRIEQYLRRCADHGLRSIKLEEMA